MLRNVINSKALLSYRPWKYFIWLKEQPSLSLHQAHAIAQRKEQLVITDETLYLPLIFFPLNVNVNNPWYPQRGIFLLINPIKHFTGKRKKNSPHLGESIEANELNGKIFKSHFGLANHANSILRCQTIQFGTYEVKYLDGVSTGHRGYRFWIKVTGSRACPAASCLVAEKGAGDGILPCWALKSTQSHAPH